MVIGLTGGIASGKTTVSNILRDYGAEIIDADKIAHQILKKGQTGWEKVVDFFGSDILNKNGEINRKKLAEIVFSDESKLKALEKITHPLIIKTIKKRIFEEKKSGKLLVLDAPLLYETKLDQLVDQVWVIYVDQKVQLERIQKRDGLSKEEALKRINSQMSLDQKRENADIVIYNNGNKEELEDKIVNLWNEI